jgi:hypothetical protein
MSSTKISALISGNPAQAGDLIPIDRAGANFSITASSVVSALSPVVAFGLLAGLVGVTYDRFYVGNAGSGDVSLYTVPANKRALVQMEAFNTAGTTTTWSPEVQIAGAGAFYHISPAISTTTATQGTFNAGMVFEAGDVVAINTSQAGLNAFGSVILFSNTSTLKSIRLASTSWTNGNNTIYTCPSTALVAGFSPFFNSSSSAPLNYVNQSGSAATIAWSLVESGSSVATANKLANNQNATVANNASAGGTTNFYLQTNDFLSLNTNQTAQQIAWVNVFEGV